MFLRRSYTFMVLLFLFMSSCLIPLNFSKLVSGGYDFTGEPYEFENKYNITLCSSISFTDARMVKVFGDYAYVAEYNKDILIIDISDPYEPTVIGNYTNDSGNAWDLCVVGDYAYIADGSDGLEILNITDPSIPTKIGQFDHVESINNVFVVESYAYLEGGLHGTIVINVSDPTSPTLMNQYIGSVVYDSLFTYDLYVEYPYAFITSGYVHNFYVFDLMDPTCPIKIGELSNADFRSGLLDVEGSYVYIAVDNYGLVIVDISDPTSPKKIAYYPIEGNWEGVSSVIVEGCLVFIAFPDGLFVIDVSNPRKAALVGVYFSGYSIINSYISYKVKDVFVVGDFLYVTYRDGLAILKCEDCPFNCSPKIIPGFPILLLVLGIFFTVAIKGIIIYRSRSRNSKQSKPLFVK